MVVFSPLALYTTYLGWQQYDILFAALWQVGLLHLGFLILAYRLFRNILSLNQSADEALNQFLFELITTLIICAFFVYPCVPLQEKGLLFKPVCSSKEASLRATGTTYDEAFASLLSPQVKLPIGFALLQEYAASLTYGLMKATGCSDSLQAIEADLQAHFLPETLNEAVDKFSRQCFLPARTNYQHDPHPPATLALLLRQYGESDLNWLGSEVLQAFYYPHLTVREPVPGFSFSEAPNAHLSAAVNRGEVSASHLPEAGYPTCQQWWLKLRGELLAVAIGDAPQNPYLEKESLLARLTHYKQTHLKAWMTALSSEDYLVRAVLAASRGVDMLNNGQAESRSWGASLSHGVINAGQWTKAWTTTPLKREAILQSLPILHAFLSFFLILLTPFVLALSGYSPRALGSLCGLFVMSSLLFYLWHLVSVVEQAVLDPLGASDIVNAMQNVAVLFYFIAPMLLLRLSVHFGGEAGGALASLVYDAKHHNDELTNTAVNTAKVAVKAASMGKLPL